MPSTSASNPGEQTGHDEGESHTKPLWKKPVVWLGTIVVAAVSASLTGWLQPKIADAIDEATETGDAVVVSVERQNSPGVFDWPPDVSLPPEVNLTDQDLAILNGMSTAEQITWLESQGGTSTGLQSLRLTLKGNRSDQVRITDMLAHTECEEPERGSLVRMAYGRGAQPPSGVMLFVIKESPEGPFALNPGATAPEPFFPHKTITLQQDEEEYIVVHLIPDADVYCRVQLEMIMEEEGEEYRQWIPGRDEFVPVMSFQLTDTHEALYSRVFYGGEVCHQYHEATPVTPETYVDISYLCGSPENYKS